MQTLRRGSGGEPRSTEDGQSLLEFALMLPFLVLLLIGVVETGRAAFISMTVANGATAAAEYGSQSATMAQDTAGMTQAAQSDANFATMTATPTQGCTCDTGSGTSCNSTFVDCKTISCSGQIVECVKVTTSATFSSLMNYPGLPSSYQANGKAIMRVRK